jgi:type IV pilus assembly protein PilB
MSSHPDADAFVSAILRNPAEVTTRLVFADWLEETGDPSNVAWAQFIRLNVEADRHPAGVRKEDAITAAFEHRGRIRARLTAPARVIVRHYATLRELIPPERLTARLRGFVPDPTATLLVTEGMAKVYRLFPLGLTRSEVMVAVEPATTSAASGLASLLGVPLISVPARAEDIEGAINRTYPVPPWRVLSVAIA